MDNREFVARFFKVLEKGDANAIADSYTDDGYVWTMGNTLISGKFGKEQIRAVSAAVLGAFPEGIRFSITGITAEGDRVAVEAESVGTHVSGKIYSNMYHFLFILRDGKIAVMKEYMDTERVTDILCDGQRPASRPK
jgi:uncharacterized protein (TIGR02246 family)